MGHLVTYYENAHLATIQGRIPCPEHIREYLKVHQELTERMGELHNNIFSAVKKNGFTWDDISPVQRSGVTDNNAYLPGSEGWYDDAQRERLR